MSPQQSGANEPETEGLPAKPPSDVSPGTVIGPYHLLQPIGYGGMGEVWLAEQKEPVRRRVAIKLIKAGMDTREVVARFEAERQTLALMDHPSIAKVFDAGSTPQGRPYFVMEYVTGVSITRYCDRQKLTIPQRLELFVRVCEGVQHAHQKAIIHRDLKPSNILVSDVDGKPLPRIIDFGVAKATSQRLTAETMFTRIGAIVGTPGYMSPEQADSSGTDVDTRTDVYSLGAVLYELLVGARPLDFQNLSFEEVLRKLREEDPPRPSTKLRTAGEQTANAADKRGTDREKLARQLRGDLDVITLKALDKERARRYSTPSELAADIGRYLRHEPVVARSASTAYRARKYIRRHRVGVAIAASIALVLVTFAIAQALELRRITAERDRAARERDRADRITRFMTDMFKVSDPSVARGNSITVREVLDKASKDIDKGLSQDPAAQAQMMYVMGDVYDDLGLYPQAQSLLARALEVRRRFLGAHHPETLRSMNTLAWVLQEQGHYAEAEKLDREVLDIRRRLLGPEHPDTLTAMNHLAIDLDNVGHYPEAEKLYRETLDIQRRVIGPENRRTLEVMTSLGWNLHTQGRYSEAENLNRQTLEIQSRVLGLDNMETMRSMNNVATDLAAEGRYPEAERLNREVLDLRLRVLGSEHPETLLSMSNLAGTLTDEGHFAEAEKLYRQVLEVQRRVLGPEQPDTAASIYNLGALKAKLARRDEAFALLREAVDHGLSIDLDLGIAGDPDLKSLHGDPRFAELVAHAKEHAVKQAK